MELLLICLGFMLLPVLLKLLSVIEKQLPRSPYETDPNWNPEFPFLDKLEEKLNNRRN